MLTYGILTNAIQNEWNIIGSFMSPLQPQNTPWLYQRQEDHFYTGFKDGMSVKRTFRYISHPLTATPLVFLGISGIRGHPFQGVPFPAT